MLFLLDLAANSVGEERQKDATPPSYITEHPPLAVFVNGISLRPCAPLSLKQVLAQELFKGLQAIADSLLRYSATRMLRENESGLFLSLCRAFIELSRVFPKPVNDADVKSISENGNHLVVENGVTSECIDKDEKEQKSPPSNSQIQESQEA
ncbi:hypothetical protein Dsin_015145 [Dipteronia sinensis]|uniref:Conserved oligomeric Golgi complex subunit 8 n=1 Tax=Dipteronia sinensis TaxID=43782 RepID=A0AAE0E4E0_9ROSI|nr:hypothetical protein Dsin_015145 [Dipteronia sinensis]